LRPDYYLTRMDQDFLALVLSGVNWQLLLAAFLGALVGLEREFAGKAPSIRTFALISMGSCLFAMLSVDAASILNIGDPGRIAAQIVPGIGFLGAGTIFRSKHGVSGFTTAALMWVMAGIGMSVGFKRADLAVTTTIIAIMLTLSLRVIHRIVKPYRLNNGEKVESDM
jgi:putative Mg2+ transporter-C (MgtC) family protein